MDKNIHELCLFKTTVNWDGFAYTKAWPSGRKTTFRCSYYRSTKCKACVDVMTDHSYQNAVPHTCGRPITENASPPATEDGVPTVVEDVVEEMKAEVDALALPNLTIVPSRIWEEIREEFTSKKMIHVEVPPLSMTKVGNATFFQFHYTYVDNGEVQHILGWDHPALIRLLSYHQTALYLDGTFHCVPSPFYQCIIVMVHDRGSKCFAPCMYSLATNKLEWTYWSSLHRVQAATGMTMDVGTVSCDFEKGLANAQAVRRNIQKLHIPTEEIYGIMKSGFIDALTVILHDRIDPHGINFVITKFKMRLNGEGLEFSESK
ncbi:hypothetical protein PHMEG_00033077 [Phytophthora megakarya]|uniref:FLYWCH-type domain-containing protein n=1 Tax=Phytophthora megakarya TaxID=4795 RepID=A0A225UTY3_9STRA|nr:hypothetical protein PHMEG_00033077 [Phytophthora megakarya]